MEAGEKLNFHTDGLGKLCVEISFIGFQFQDLIIDVLTDGQAMPSLRSLMSI